MKPVHPGKTYYILGQARKSNNFRIKYHGSKSKKRKSAVKKIGSDGKINDYTFNHEDGASKSDISNSSRKSNLHNKSFVSASPFKKSKLKIKLLNLNSDTLMKSDSKSVIKPKTMIKKVSKKYNLEDFTILSLLGYGTFGSVLLVKHPNSYTPFALKVVK